MGKLEKFREWCTFSKEEKRSLARFCFIAFVIWLIALGALVLYYAWQLDNGIVCRGTVCW